MDKLVQLITAATQETVSQKLTTTQKSCKGFHQREPKTGARVVQIATLSLTACMEDRDPVLQAREAYPRTEMFPLEIREQVGHQRPQYHANLLDRTHRQDPNQT